MLPLIAAIEQELSSNRSGRLLSAQELGALDNIHTRGFASTIELAQAISPTKEMHVLDIGSGLGGPARYLAEKFGCQVEGIDITPPFVEASKYLNTRWSGPQDLVNFTAASALDLPFPDETFDLAWMLHVAMNIADRAALYREIRRVLRPGGRFVTYDVLLAKGELIYPTPWAPSQAVSTVLSKEQTREEMKDAGLEVLSFALDTQAALEWVRAAASVTPKGEHPPGAIMFRAVLGDNFREIVGNLGRNYSEGRADVGTFVAQRRG